MSIPIEYKISFDEYKKDLVEQALNKMLSQFYSSCVLRQFVAAFVDELQEAYDAILEMQEARTLYNADYEVLNAFGRIVGAKREIWEYQENRFFTFDAQGLGFEQAPLYMEGAQIKKRELVDDQQYSKNILAQITKNHTLIGSTPEVVEYIKMLLGETVSIQKTGPNQIRLIVRTEISTVNLFLLTRFITNERFDESAYIPLPATVDIGEVITFAPDNFFNFDMEGRGFDIAPLAVSVNV